MEFGKALNLKWAKEILESIENELDISKSKNIADWKEFIYKKYEMVIK